MKNQKKSSEFSLFEHENEKIEENNNKRKNLKKINKIGKDKHQISNYKKQNH
jgi:hypothetical protein